MGDIYLRFTCHDYFSSQYLMSSKLLHPEVGGHLQLFISIINIPSVESLAGVKKHEKTALLCSQGFFVVFFPIVMGKKKLGSLLMGHLSFFSHTCHSEQLAVLFISSLFCLKNVIPTAFEDPYPDMLFTLQANISVFIALQNRIDTFESNYPSDTLRGQVICFDGTRQEN